jgi:hypothetical protein
MFLLEDRRFPIGVLKHRLGHYTFLSTRMRFAGALNLHAACPLINLLAEDDLNKRCPQVEFSLPDLFCWGLFGGRAISGRDPLALRPRLTTGVP